jgi:EmrB/QacA subfamily drug resistance transporter
VAEVREQQTVRPGATLGVLLLSALAFALAQTAVVPALAPMAGALNTSPQNISWVLSGYSLSAAIFTPIMGRLGDMFGRRRLLIISLVVFGVASALAALSGNVWVLVAARVVQGVSGGIFPLCFAIIGETFPPSRRPTALGLISATAGIGAGAGLLMGGLLTDHLSWHWVFWVGAIMSVVAIAGAVRVPDSGVRSPGRIDVVGAVLLAVGLTAILLALTKTADWGWGDPKVIGMIVGGLVVLAGFGRYESRTEQPLVDVRVFRMPPVVATNVTTLLVGIGMFGAFVLIPQIAQTPEASGYGFGLDSTGAGLLLLPASVAMLVTGPLCGVLSIRFGPKVPLTAGMVIGAAGLAALTEWHGTQLSVIVLASVVFAGIGMTMAAVPNILVASVPSEMTGQVTGVNALIRSVGSSFGSQAVGALLAASATLANPLPTDDAFTQAFALGAGALALAGVAAVFVPRPSRADAERAEAEEHAHGQHLGEALDPAGEVPGPLRS